MQKLDQDILAWIADHNDSAGLKVQIAGVEVARRDYMRTGYFIYFDVAADAEPVEKSLRPVSPDIMSAELLHGAGTTLFLRNGRMHYLEIFARGGFFPEALKSYELAVPG